MFWNWLLLLLVLFWTNGEHPAEYSPAGRVLRLCTPLRSCHFLCSTRPTAFYMLTSPLDSACGWYKSPFKWGQGEYHSSPLIPTQAINSALTSNLILSICSWKHSHPLSFFWQHSSHWVTRAQRLARLAAVRPQIMSLLILHRPTALLRLIALPQVDWALDLTSWSTATTTSQAQLLPLPAFRGIHTLICFQCYSSSQYSIAHC